MAFTDKIRLVIDVVATGANKSLSSLKTQLGNTDTALGKTKTIGTKAFDSIKAHAVEGALAAGSALVLFATKSVMAFQDTALQAGQLRDALGLSADEASRLAEVAGDVGIDVGALEKTIGRMNREAENTPSRFDEIGAAIVRNKDGTINVNETFLSTVEALGKIPDATVRAAAAQEIFGRSWQDIAELVGMGADDIRTAMDEVAEGKVIDDEEIQKAREFRESMDKLKDSVEEVMLAIGEDLVPTLGTLAEGLAAVIGPLQSINSWSKDVTQSIIDQTAAMVGQKKEAIDPLIFGYGKLGEEFVKEAISLDHLDERTHAYTMTAESAAKAVDREREASEEHTKALEEQRRAVDELFSSKTALIGGDIAVRDAQRQASAAVAEFNTLAAEGKATTDELSASQDGAADSMINAAHQAAEWAIQQAEANGQALSGESKTNLLKQKLIELAGTLAPDSPLRAQLQGYIDQLNSVKSEINTRFTISAVGATVTPHGDAIGSTLVPRASGGPVRAGVGYMVGERGPEPFIPSTNGTIIPNNQIGVGGGGGNTYILQSLVAPNEAQLQTFGAWIEAHERRRRGMQ